MRRKRRNPCYISRTEFVSQFWGRRTIERKSPEKKGSKKVARLENDIDWRG